uniref:hypothetical protein n=1 Tax=Snodgrassella alvi TaxID=1196083 RepID=UPI0035A27BE2
MDSSRAGRRQTRLALHEPAMGRITVYTLLGFTRRTDGSTGFEKKRPYRHRIHHLFSVSSPGNIRQTL